MPGVVKRKGNLYVDPGCHYPGNRPPLGVSAREFDRVFTIPTAQSSRISFFIHPAAIPAGTAVLSLPKAPCQLCRPSRCVV